MIPIAEDRQTASASPIIPSAMSLIVSDTIFHQIATIGISYHFLNYKKLWTLILGFFSSILSIIFYVNMETFVSGDIDKFNNAAFGPAIAAVNGGVCNDYAQVVMWLQLSVSAELLIYSTRSRGLFILSRPSFLLMFSTLIFGVLLSCLLAVYVFSAGRGNPNHRGIRWDDAGVVCAYDVACLCILDIIKLIVKHEFNIDNNGTLDEERYAQEDNALNISGSSLQQPPPSLLAAGGRGRSSHRAIHMASSLQPRTWFKRLSSFLMTGRRLSRAAPNHEGRHFSHGPGFEMQQQTRKEHGIVSNQAKLK
jgi:hypothetical protein